jgi:hypothetical protein
VYYLLWRGVMEKCWEGILGEWVLFSQVEGSGWQWRCRDLNVQQAPGVRYPTLSAARVGCACLVFAFFVTEEVTSVPDPLPAGGGLRTSGSATPPPTPPPEGTGGVL